jgi:hypothetical protein
MKQQVDGTTSWWNNKLMKQQVDETTSWRNNKLTKPQVDKTTSWRNNKLTKQQVDETWKRDMSKRLECGVSPLTDCQDFMMPMNKDTIS